MVPLAMAGSLVGEGVRGGCRAGKPLLVRLRRVAVVLVAPLGAGRLHAASLGDVLRRGHAHAAVELRRVAVLLAHPDGSVVDVGVAHRHHEALVLVEVRRVGALERVEEAHAAVVLLGRVEDELVH
eukprot:scaffold105585_cov72-Phaeocystis_antarctica.AAC.2